MLRNVFYICSLITIMLLVPTQQSEAALHDLHMEWTYDEDVNNPAESFSLYCNGIPAKDSIASNDRMLDFILNADEGNLTFTLTAVMSDGYESPHSAPYIFAATSPVTPSAPKGFQHGLYKKDGSLLYFTRTIVTTDINKFQLNTNDSEIVTLTRYSFGEESVFTTNSLAMTHCTLQSLLSAPPSFTSKSLEVPTLPRMVAITIRKLRIMHT